MKQKLRQIGPDSSSSLLLRCFQSFILLLFLCIATTSAAALIDVTAYGAIPNDAVDDTWAIQKAVDMAPDNSTIYFPRGVYLLAGVRINNRTGLTLAGDGSTLTILKRSGTYPKIVESIGSTDILVTQLGFDVSGITSFGGFSFYNAKRITITKTHFFDSNKQPVGGYDRYSWVFGRGSVPSEDILISDNLIQDLQLEVDFSRRVRIEGNTVVRPVQTAGIGVFTINDNSSAEDYTIQKNTIVDPVVSAGGIVLHLDPPSTSYSTMKTFRILDNHIVYTKYINANHASAIRLGTGDNSQTTTGNVFDDIVIQNNVAYKDPGSPYEFFHPIIFGNSSRIANFIFDNTNVSNNLVYYNNRFGISIVDIRQKGINYIESNNVARVISADVMPPSVPTALTVTYISNNRIDLSWNASVDNIGVSRYRIYRNGSAHTYSTATSYADTNLQPGTTYTYTVTAIDSSGIESSQSYYVTAETSGIATPAPTAPIANPNPVTRTILTASPEMTAAGGTLTAAWNGIASPTSTDWIGLYKLGAPNASYIDWIYVSCAKSPGTLRASGSCPFVVPTSVRSGTYELRLFAYNRDNILATSNGFTVKVPKGRARHVARR
jgi:chitodextrinase